MPMISPYLRSLFFTFVLLSISTLSILPQKVAEMVSDRISQADGEKEVEEFEAQGGVAAPINADIAQTSSYLFATSTTGSLIDMSAGTTQLIAANNDDAPASPLTNIGFDFYFQGVRYSQFSVNSNGVMRLGAVAQGSTPYKPLAQAEIPIITAYGADQRTHVLGKVHFKVTGSSGSRVLTIEWLNMQSNFNASMACIGGCREISRFHRRSYTTTARVCCRSGLGKGPVYLTGFDPCFSDCFRALNSYHYVSLY